MDKLVKETIGKLLTDEPLYNAIHISIRLRPLLLDDLTFSFHCQHDNSVQTFKLRCEPDKLIDVCDEKGLTREVMKLIGSQQELNDGESYNFTSLYSGTCQYCNEFKAFFLLRYESKDSADGGYQTLTKVGQFPPYNIKPDKDLRRFLNDEDRENYRKALICRSQSFGIASFAYLRRIVENEMVRLIEKLAELDRNESVHIRGLLERFKQDHVMSNLIEGIYSYLPQSLKSLGNNPLKLLYGQLSGGIHEFEDEVCLKKANDMDALLIFVVKKIREESLQVKGAIEAVKRLSSPN